MESIQKAIKMYIDDTHKTLTLLGHFLKSLVKSMTYRDVFIEWEWAKFLVKSMTYNDVSIEYE